MSPRHTHRSSPVPTPVPALHTQTLPQPAPARVLACGAFLKNTACLIDGAQAHWSPQHGDLGTPEACAALDASLHALVAKATGPIDAVAHDLHPDFHSTRLAQAWAQRLGVPALAVQHHQAHIGVVLAEQGWTDWPVVGLALDGVGLGSDGLAWGGELLGLRGAQWQRLAHLPALALPGGDVAAREPWRLAAAVLHAAGRGDEIATRFGPAVGAPATRVLQQMLARGLNCPPTTSAGRWFDAAAGALGLSLRQTEEAQAAIALERAATAWLAAPCAQALSTGTPGFGTSDHPRTDLGNGPQSSPPALLAAGLPALVLQLFDEPDTGRGAARFHQLLAQGLVAAAAAAARAHGSRHVVLGGGCFFNALLRSLVCSGLQAHGLGPLLPASVNPGDAGLALGQAWLAACQLASNAQAHNTAAHNTLADSARASPPTTANTSPLATLEA